MIKGHEVKLILKKDNEVAIFLEGAYWRYGYNDEIFYGAVEYNEKTGELNFDGHYVPKEDLTGVFSHYNDKIARFSNNSINTEAVKFLGKIRRRYSINNGYGTLKKKHWIKKKFYKHLITKKVTVHYKP